MGSVFSWVATIIALAGTMRREKYPLAPYIQQEKEYIRRKQEKATERNRRRKLYKTMKK